MPPPAFRRLPPLALLALLILAPAFAACSGDTFRLVGTVERKNIELAAPSSEVIVGIPVKVGDRVRDDEVVVQLDVDVAQAELRAFEARYEAAQAALLQAQQDFERIRNLRKAQVTAQADLDRARRERDAALAAEAEAAANLTQSQKRLRDFSIRTTAAGVVDQIPFDVGERVPAGGVVAVILADEDPWVRVWLPADATAHARPGLPATIRVQGFDDEFEGRLDDIAREPEFTPHYALTERERDHLVFETRFVILNAPAGLRPGVAADVRLTIPRGSGGGQP